MYIFSYKITPNAYYTTCIKVGIQTDPDNDPLKLFLSGVKVNEYPDLVESIAKSQGYGGEYWHYRPYSAMDWEDIAYANGIEEGEVHIIHDVFGQTILEEKQFCEILYDYGTRVLEVYREDETVQAGYTQFLKGKLAPNSWDREYYVDFDPNWAKAMENGLAKLKAKINTA